MLDVILDPMADMFISVGIINSNYAWNYGLLAVGFGVATFALVAIINFKNKR